MFPQPRPGRAADDRAAPADSAPAAVTSPAATSRTDPVAEAKTALRRAVYTHRRNRLATDPAAVAAAGIAVRDRLLASPEIAALRPGSTVAAYLELRSEVPTSAVRAALLAAGIRVVVPVLLPDGDLDWAAAPGSPGSGGTGRGAEPVRFGPETITEVGVVLLPGVAADPAGHRLGRGGGSYDRALARLAALPTDARPWTCLVLFADEVVPEVPVTDHDVTVDAVVTPGGLLRTVSRTDDD